MWKASLLSLACVVAAAESGETAAPVDFERLRLDIKDILDNPVDPFFDDGSLAPIVLRLSFHSASHYDGETSPHGGTNGATMRFEPERSYHENRGLELARESLEPLLEQYSISASDLWVLSGYVAVETLGGPRIDFRAGREDAPRGDDLCPPEERMPAWDDGSDALRQKFAKMGINDRDIVALMGGHSVGKSHCENSGFPYKNWDFSPVDFDNAYYQFLLDDIWIPDTVAGNDGDGELRFYYSRGWIMLETDMILKEDPLFRPYVEEYAEDEAKWHADFAAAFKKITELGLDSTTIITVPTTTM
jgi:cytochrome c peroxidase